jgi:hypothetical protein
VSGIPLSGIPLETLIDAELIVEQIARELPPRLRDDIVGYARSVETALPEIFRDAGVRRTESLAQQLVFIAGVKKIYSICSSNYWILESSLHALRDHAESVRLGSTVVSRSSPYFLRLQELNSDLLEMLGEHHLSEFMEIGAYSEILRRIAREH